MTDVTQVEATDLILGQFKTRWDADSGALNGSVVPTIVYEATEPDLKPHPRDSALPWARIVVRHNDAIKVTLNCENGTARYRRTGLAWVQVFVPSDGAEAWTKAQRLAIVAQKAYEGQRAAGGAVVFTKAAILDRPKDGPWFTFDIKVNFYWDEVK
jgi:hypothetical protein